MGFDLGSHDRITPEILRKLAPYRGGIEAVELLQSFEDLGKIVPGLRLQPRDEVRANQPEVQGHLSRRSLTGPILLIGHEVHQLLVIRLPGKQAHGCHWADPLNARSVVGHIAHQREVAVHLGRRHSEVLLYRCCIAALPAPCYGDEPRDVVPYDLGVILVVGRDQHFHPSPTLCDRCEAH